MGNRSSQCIEQIRNGGGGDGVQLPDAAPQLDAQVVELVKAQKAYFATGATRSIPWRIEQIKKLCETMRDNTEKISEAMASDNVVPSHFAGSAGMLMGAMGYYLSKVGEWSAPKVLDDTLPAERRGGVECDWLALSEPKGVVLNIAPWNAPVLLSVLPMLGALAAGNTCVIKPPDSCPATSKLLKEIISSNMSPQAVAVVEGGADVVNGLIDMDFDHIMFTGGTSIGRLIMARAARTLTPVTLELGGKNPVMIDTMDDAFLAAAIKEIVHTKAYFAGEFCQCHDYILVVESMWDKFTKALGESVEALGEKRFVRMIHERHYTRVKRMLLEHQGQFLPSAAPQPDDEGLRLPVTAVLEPQPNDFIMLDEVFGPCWAVLKVASVSEGIAKVTSMPTGKPLVSYYYGQSQEGSDAWMNGTSSGSLAINSGPMRMQSNFNAAIHGVGNSGLGGASIWGRHVFETFSHTKHVVRPKDGAFAGSIWAGSTYKPSAGKPSAGKAEGAQK